MEVDLGLNLDFSSGPHLEARQKNEKKVKDRNMTKCTWPAQIEKAALGTSPLK